jgi:hypothetical protein
MNVIRHHHEVVDNHSSRPHLKPKNIDEEFGHAIGLKERSPSRRSSARKEYS